MSVTMEQNSSTIKRTLILVVAVIIIIIFVGSVLFVSRGDKQPAATSEPIAVSNSPTSSQPTPSPIASTVTIERKETPIPAAKVSLPFLNNSDQHVIEQISKFNNSRIILSLLEQEEIIRKIVRAVYGLSEGRVVRQYRPIKSPKGVFLANQTGDYDSKDQAVYAVDKKNILRYESHIQVLESINVSQLADFFHTHSSLFEEAYSELGVGKGSFRETLSQAIDNVLAAPEYPEEYDLIRPTVMYKFTDVATEKSSGAHKLMIRMGKENRQKIKVFLSALKKEIYNP